MAKKKSTREPAAINSDLKAEYERIRRQFTAGDLQKYAEVEPGIPARTVLTEMKKIHQAATRKKS